MKVQWQVSYFEQVFFDLNPALDVACVAKFVPD
jgi:hypothetical protein